MNQSVDENFNIKIFLQRTTFKIPTIWSMHSWSRITCALTLKTILKIFQILSLTIIQYSQMMILMKTQIFLIMVHQSSMILLIYLFGSQMTGFERRAKRSGSRYSMISISCRINICTKEVEYTSGIEMVHSDVSGGLANAVRDLDEYKLSCYHNNGNTILIPRRVQAR
jgi:hypothetical protein